MFSKGLSVKRIVVSSIAIAICVAVCNGCGWEFGGDFNAYPCNDPNYVDYHSIRCVDARCGADAGIPEDNCNDGGSSSSSSSGSSARCPGTCVPNAPNGFDHPQPVYIGPAKSKYLFGCPPEMGSFGAPNQYNDLRVPSPGCPTCVCASIQGFCAPPTSIALRADTCGVQPASHFDFSGPTDWGGSCTNVNAMPAGAECPPGSGISCAQSIDAATLAPPIEACEPVPLPVPNATSDSPYWTNTVMSCSSSTLAGACDAIASETCLPALPTDETGWLYCVQKVGIHACPMGNGAKFVNQFVAYDGFIDTRKCTPCECGASGGSCYGTLRAYKDSACSTNEIVANTVFSDMPNCTNLPPSGDSFGSKELTDLTYVPGKCEPKGGESIGDVVPVKTKVTPEGDVVESVTTWCCMEKKPSVSPSM